MKKQPCLFTASDEWKIYFFAGHYPINIEQLHHCKINLKLLKFEIRLSMTGRSYQFQVQML